MFLQFGTRIGANGAISHAAHLSLLSYDPQGMPVWYAAEGTLGADLSLEGMLYRYAGGAPVGQMTGGAVPSATPSGNFRLSFTAADRATLRLADGSTRNLDRFRFRPPCQRQGPARWTLPHSTPACKVRKTAGAIRPCCAGRGRA